MAGWSYSGPTKAIGLWTRNNPDGRQKDTAFPTVTAGEADWWQDFAYRVGQEFALESATKGSGVVSVSVSANNGAGDTNGVGTLAITLVTA